jgi:two-component system, sensor histidine kinase and response regulator
MSKILVIEDQPDIRMTLLEILEAENFETRSAENGAQGIQLAKHNHFDLILCDVMMPDVDGHEVLQTLRQKPETATVPFVFLTAKATMDEVRQGMNLGADDYLTKPFTRDSLMQAIETRLSKQQKITEQSEEQLNSLRKRISYSLLNKILDPLDKIEKTSESLILGNFAPDHADTVNLGKQIHGQARFLQRSINNLYLYMHIDLLAKDPENMQEGKKPLMINPADFLSMLSIQSAKNYNREQDLNVQVENSPIGIPIDDFEKIIQETLEFVFSSSQNNTPVYVQTELDKEIFSISITSQKYLRPELLARISQGKQLDREFFESLDPGLGLLIVHQIAKLYKGQLTIESNVEKQLTINILFPVQKTTTEPKLNFD